MIEIDNLVKIYKLSKKQMAKEKLKEGRKVAVNGVSFKAEKVEIFGLLGPNGAGKTTTLRCISTLLKPTSGTVKVDSYDTVTQSREVRGKIGFLTNEINLDPQFTPKYMFDFFGKMHGVPEDVIEERRKELFDYFGITSFEDKKVSELSTGMKQKASIAVSLVHDPEIVIFDEPTSGLDIITARQVTDYLKKLRDNGKSVIISTHIMSEAEKLCDRLAVIINGQKVAEGTVEEIKASTGGSDLEEAFFVLYKEDVTEEVQ